MSSSKKDMHELISLYISGSIQELRDVLSEIEKNNLTGKKDILSVAKKVHDKKWFVDFIDKLVDDKGNFALSELLSYFDKKLVRKLNLQRLEVLIRTAKPLSSDDINTLVHAIEEKYNRKALVKTEVDESLIGGIVVKINDKMIDLSFKTQMNKLKNIVS